VKYGYARVSTQLQARGGNSLEKQEKDLKAAGAEKIYADAFTGKRMDRPEFQKLLREIQSGDTLIVTKLDRFARSIGAASELITELIDKGITVQVLNVGILDNSSVSTLFRNMLLSFAQFERDMIVERTQEGRAIARQKEGYREGRKKKFTEKQLDHAMSMLEENSYTEVAAATGISKSTLIREHNRRTQKDGR